jgi:ATP-dependent Clp protease ATP-binding subunit ClpB
MTSNLGSEYILSGNKAPLDGLLHKTFKPEFLNRIDEIVYFNALEKATQKLIVAKMLGELGERLKKQYFDIEFTDDLEEAILDAAYSPEFGARPLKRYIAEHVETALATKIIEGSVEIETPYRCKSDGGSGILLEPRPLAA